MTNSPAESAVLRKISIRVLPFLFLLYVVNYLDRVNVSFAALQMKPALNLSDSVFGFGAGIFFVGYLLFQIPSNLVLQRIGARRWLTVLIILWGAISSCTMFVRTPFGFYTFRFLLGLAESGFFPGVILYLTYWFPPSVRARSVSRFMIASTVSGVIGAPLSGAILSLQGTHGLAGWQWLFLLEGAPAILLGFILPFVLTDRPEHAAWLTNEDRSTLSVLLEGEGNRSAQAQQLSISQIIFRAETWLICGAYFALTCGSYGTSIWLPLVIKNFSGLGNFQVGMLTAIPYLSAAIVMVFVAAFSDKTRKPHAHFAGSVFAAAAALALTTQTHQVILSIALLCVALAGINSSFGPFWAMPGRALSGPAAATAIAFINSIGNLGGFFGPYVSGAAKQFTGSFTTGTLIIAVVLFFGGLLALRARRA
ncbi:MAG TPA: MFS transporter [Candidatus Acidoferrales bacterium]|jgi:sugar phosphate permease|nr:MFS transporter [Candidatus Acidoferrales bacterium]